MTVLQKLHLICILLFQNLPIAENNMLKIIHAKIVRDTLKSESHLFNSYLKYFQKQVLLTHNNTYKNKELTRIYYSSFYKPSIYSLNLSTNVQRYKIINAYFWCWYNMISYKTTAWSPIYTWQQHYIMDMYSDV